MRVLRSGSGGEDVRHWQAFLAAQRLQPGPLDGMFGPRTVSATAQFQTLHGIQALGVAGPQTLRVAESLGFEPPEPDSSAQPLVALTDARREELFGKLPFMPVPTPGNPERIRILNGWEERNIIAVRVPQLAGIAGAPEHCTVLLHRLAAKQLQQLWRTWEQRGLLKRILSWDGSYAPRLQRGSASKLSNHAYGTAFDINAAWNSMGERPASDGQKGSVMDLVPAASELGFFWGGDFHRRPDGMHFEIARLLP